VDCTDVDHASGAVGMAEAAVRVPAYVVDEIASSSHPITRSPPSERPDMAMSKRARDDRVLGGRSVVQEDTVVWYVI